MPSYKPGTSATRFNALEDFSLRGKLRNLLLPAPLPTLSIRWLGLKVLVPTHAIWLLAYNTYNKHSKCVLVLLEDKANERRIETTPKRQEQLQLSITAAKAKNTTVAQGYKCSLSLASAFYSIDG
jgi:hypothetical protein